MNKNVLIWVIILIVLIGHPVGALRVYGSSMRENLSPGQSFIHEMALVISANDSAIDALIEVTGLGQLPDFRYYHIPPNDDKSPYSARSFITVDKKSTRLLPGEPVTLNATIKVPVNVGPGGRYAIIFIHTVPSGSGATGISTAVMVPIAITIAGSKIVQTGTIADVLVGKVTKGLPIVVATNFTNTGNHDIANAYNDVIVTDASGKIVFNGTATSSIFPLIPGYLVQFKVSITEPLPPGGYFVSSKVMVSNETIFDEKTTTFEVQKEYAPPFKDVTITLSPGITASLASSDGMIAVNFPKGAVLDTIKVTLKAVPSTDLQRAPKGAKLGSTGFSVEGLTGLLSKDATITVKYSPEDLDAASGDASKLMLARWDRAINQWTLMPTTVDKSAGTLTVTTNQLSIWAVMVSEGAVPEGTKVDGFTVSIACGALALLFIVNRLRK